MADSRDSFAVTKKEVVHSFYSLLTLQDQEAINKQLKKYPLLKPWFVGKEVNLGSESNPDKYIISFPKLRRHLIAAFKSRNRPLIEGILANEKLRAYIKGNRINIGDEANPNWIIITTLELQTIFQKALSSQKDYIIKPLSKLNLFFKPWLRGEKINIGTADSIDTLTEKDLLTRFQAVLASHSVFAMEVTWKKNSRLQKAIRNLNFNYLKNLTCKVLATNRPLFVASFLTWLNNIELLNALMAQFEIEGTRAAKIKYNLLLECYNTLINEPDHKRKKFVVERPNSRKRKLTNDTLLPTFKTPNPATFFAPSSPPNIHDASTTTCYDQPSLDQHDGDEEDLFSNAIPMFGENEEDEEMVTLSSLSSRLT